MSNDDYHIIGEYGSNAHMGRKILLAANNSEVARHVFGWALDKLLLPTDKLHVIFVKPTNRPYNSPRFCAPKERQPHLDGIDIHDPDNIAEDVRAQALMDELHSLAALNHLNFEEIMRMGDAKEEIVETAKELQIDIIIVGSRGLSSVKRVIMGSVSDHCAHHAPCATVVVPYPMAPSVDLNF